MVFAAASYGLLSVHYALFTAAITVYIIVLTVHSGEAPLQADGERVIGTVAGLAIAYAAFILLPSPEAAAGNRLRPLPRSRA